jgi:hypothetical protein
LFLLFKKEDKLKLKPLDSIFCDGMYFPRTVLTDTIQKVIHLFEEVDLVIKSVKNSTNSEYWFVKLCEDSTPEWHEMKARLLKLMKTLRSNLGRDVYLG